MALDLTGFGYVGQLWDERGVGDNAFTTAGGLYIIGTATSAMNIGDLIAIDTTADNSYKTTTTANSPLASGLFLRAFSPGVEPSPISAVIGNRIAILVNGVHTMTAAGTINRGDLLVSSTTAGAVIANNSASAGTIVGKALSAATVGLTFTARIVTG